MRPLRTGSTGTSMRGCSTIRMTSQGCSVRTLRIATTRMTSRSSVGTPSSHPGSERFASGDASTRDAPGTYDAEYSPVAVGGDTVVATGTSRYRELSGGPVVRTYENCIVMRFDGEGRCRGFTVSYLRRP
jgi:hypothetical protein